MHSLNLPALPEKRSGDGSHLEWDVRLDSDGDITVRLIEKHPYMSTETIAKTTQHNRARAEEEAARMWENYKAVHGLEN